MAGLSGAPVDGYGVGTSLVTGSGAPTCGFVYKLVARAGSSEPDGPLVAVAKRSSHKTTVGGKKWAVRRLSPKGTAVTELMGIGEAPPTDDNDRPLLLPLVRDGKVVGREPLTDARARHQRAMAELPVEAGKLSRGEPAIDTEYISKG
jgi:nicotinate phosphoribosyltransferase